MPQPLTKPQVLLFFQLLLLGIIITEVILVSIFTGFLPNKFSFLLWNKFTFFADYLLHEPFETLSFILIEKPVFKIEFIQRSSLSVIWSLHYYSYSLLLHIIIAALCTFYISRSQNLQQTWHKLPVTGFILLIFSSLSLYLASCCSGGANWVFHTSLLALFFNPAFASEPTIELYKTIQPLFNWFQFFIFLLASYLTVKKIIHIR